MAKKTEKKVISIRSSAAEYLTFVAATGDDKNSVEVRYEDENIWITQKMLAVLYEVDVRTINYHIKKIFEDSELTEESTIRNFRIVQTEGTRQVSRDVEHYNLQMIIAVGFKVNSERAVQFRKWVNQIAKDYTIQGWVLDSDRLKNGGSILTKDYFKRLLEEIREIRISERQFYQKITDLYATAIDYDKTAKTTKDFFAKVQNKLHWAIHKHTAAELIYERADSTKENMGLTSWEGSPDAKIRKSDVSIAKNYLSKDEIHSLELIVSGYLDFAEMQANRNIPMTMEDWAKHLDRILMANEQEILTNAGKISMEVAKEHAETEWEKYRIIQDRIYQSDFDLFLEDVKKLKKR
ncbi:MAG: virulence RhuM family protein [Treponema sp.]|nr:virulence RhuM family protein [Treponema sp.]